MCPAPKGNEYYLTRSTDGRKTEYTPEEFMSKAHDYFQWVQDNPFRKQEIVKYRDSHSKDSVEVMRPFTIQGLCIYAGITHQTFLNYEKREEFFEVLSHIRGVIENQQFEGAASGFLNANIIARKLGLRDTREYDVNYKKKEVGDVFPDELDG